MISCDRDCDKFLESVNGVSDVEVGKVDLAFSDVRLSNSTPCQFYKSHRGRPKPSLLLRILTMAV